MAARSSCACSTEKGGLDGLETSAPVAGDNLALPVRWEKPLAELGDQPFRLEFVLRDAEIYGFSFANAPR